MTEALRSALEDLAANAPRQSETARLHGHLEQIEHALRLGVSRAQIFETLQKQGFRMNLKSFETALYRLRKRSRLAEASASVTPPVRQPRERKRT
ncbi:hypothetical protein [Cupriavidus necator]